MVARVKKKKAVVLNQEKTPAQKKETKKINPIKPVPKNESKEQKKSEGSEKDSKEKELEKLKTVKNPYKDRLFQRSLKEISKNAKDVQVHPEANKKKEEIKEASPLSSKEQTKDNDLKENYSSIDKSTNVQEEKKFSAKKFKALLKTELDKLEDKLPHSSSSAKKFKRDKPLSDLKGNVNSKVVSSKKDTLGDLETSVKNDNAKSTKEVTLAKELKPEEPFSKPKIIVNSRYASPKKKHDSEISMEKESKEMDTVMVENNVTDKQLEISNEKSFIETLSSKNTAKQKAKEAPLEYRKSERKILSRAARGVSAHSNKEFTGMMSVREKNFNSVLTKQVKSKDKNQEKKRAINKKFEDIYLDTKKKVNKKLDGLTSYIDGFFEEKGLVTLAKKVFEVNVERKLDDIYGWTTLDDKIFGEDIEAIEKVFRNEKKRFIRTLDAIFDKIAKHISDTLNDSINLIKKGKIETKTLYDGLSKDEKELAKESYENFTDKYTDLEEKVNDKEKELAQSLASKYKKNVDSLDETFAAIKKKASSSWIDKAIDSIKGVIDTIKKLGELIATLASELKSFIPKILDDPISFVKLLFGGVVDGINLFKENIKKHIITGFVKWLTGALGPMNITLPKDIFSLSGIFSLVMQILGLGWDFIRRKAVRAFGEPAVKVLETTFEMFKIFKKDGLKGIWKFIKDKFNDLKEMVLEEIKTMLITQVIIAGVKWLVGLFVPGGAFIKAVIAIKDLIVTIVETALAIIPIIINAVKALASGNVKGLSKLVEQGLASLVAIIIGIFAKILGLGGLSKKVIKIIEKVRKKIDRAVDKLIDKAKKFLGKFFKKGKKPKKGLKDKKEKNYNKKLDKTLGEEVKFKASKENHRLWIKKSGKKIEIMVASTPSPIETRLILWEKKLKDIDEEKQKKAKGYIGKAKALVGRTKKKASDEDILKKSILKDKLVSKDEYKKMERSDRDVVKEEVQLKNYLMLLFNIFGHDAYDFKTHYKKELDAIPLIKGYVIGFVNKKITKEMMQNWQNVLKVLKDGNFVSTLRGDTHSFDKNLRRKSIVILRRIIKNKELKVKFDEIVKKYKDNKNEEGYISNRIGTIRTNVATKIEENLTGKKFDNSDFTTLLKEYLKGSLSSSSSTDHTKYEPNSTLESVVIGEKEFTIKYKYKDPIHRKDRVFTVSFDFAKLNKNDREVVQTSKGENLMYKRAAGITERGKTDSTKNFLDEKKKQKLQRELETAKSDKKQIQKEITQIRKEIKQAKQNEDGNAQKEAQKRLDEALEKEKRIDNIIKNNRAIDYKEYKAEELGKSVEGYKKHTHLFESAHLIADEFMGSGYKEALNLVVTSEEYNRKVMRKAEVDIKEEVGIKLFDLNVKATWDYLKDKEISNEINYKSILEKIKSESKDEETKKILSKDFASKLQQTLIKKDDPKRVLGVEYTGKKKSPDEALTKREIGCDIWMSSYFKFDNKSKCKYMYKVG